MILIERQKIKYYQSFEEGYPEKFRDITEKGGLTAHLAEQVEFSGNLTFSDFFNHLLREKEVINKVFYSAMGGLKIDDFVDDINQDKKIEKDGLGHVQVCWRAEVQDEGVDIECCFDGVGKDSEGNRENGVETIYGLMFSPLYTYTRLPFKLNTLFVIEQYFQKGKPKVKTILKTSREFTVFDVINAALYEITWMGTPAMRDKEAFELEKTTERIKQGKEKLYTMEEVKKRSRDKLKQ